MQRCYMDSPCASLGAQECSRASGEAGKSDLGEPLKIITLTASPKLGVGCRKF